MLLSCCAHADLDVLAVPSEFVSDGSQFGSEATVYLFREPIGVAKLISTTVSIDGTTRGSLMDHTFMRLRVPAGTRRFQVGAFALAGVPKLDVLLAIEEGKTYWLVYGAERDWTLITASLGALRKDQAEEKLKTYGERYNADTMPMREDSATAQVKMPGWQDAVLQRVRAVWVPPQDYKKGTVRGQIRAKFAANGRLLNLGWIQKTDGWNLDRSIVNAFKAGSPFPAPPDPEQAAGGIVFTFVDETAPAPSDPQPSQ
jgi:hypothetical protein